MNLPAYIKEIRQRGLRSFTIKQLLTDFNVSSNNARVALHRALSQGDLISPARGLYVIVPPECQPYGSIPAEELVPLLMNYLEAEYYVGLLSAAGFYGATHQKVARFQVITNKRIKHPLEFGQVKLEMIYKKKICGLPVQDFTVSTGYLKVASPELVVFDLLNYPLRCGGLNHIATVLSELSLALNLNRLIEFADQTGERAWLQRLGFILEKIDSMDQEKVLQIVDRLQSYLNEKSLSFIPLASEIQKKGFPYIKKWKIIENTDIESDL